MKANIRRVIGGTACVAMLIGAAAQDSYADWGWDADSGEPAFVVGGDIPPCSAYFDASIPAFVMAYPHAAVGNRTVFASRNVGEFDADFLVAGRFTLPSAAYDLAILLGSPDYDPLIPGSGQWVSVRFHRGFHHTLTCGSRTAASIAEYDASTNEGYPQAGHEYQFVFERNGGTMHAAFYRIVDGLPELIAEHSWTTYSPTVALTQLCLVGTASHLFDDGLVFFTQLSVASTACDLCHAGDDCAYTCLNVDNVLVAPTATQPGQPVVVELDYAISGTAGHIIYVGLALSGRCAGEFYAGVPGPQGASGSGQATFSAPTTAGQYPLFVAVAHVYNYQQLCQAITEGEADLLPIGTLTVVCPSMQEDFPQTGLPGWQATGNGQWTWNAEAGGIAKQTYQADDDLTVLKKLDESYSDFEFTVRWRQDSGPTVSSAMSVLFRMGDMPGPGANVPGIGPHYALSWCRTWAHYGHPDMSLIYAEGYYQEGSNIYWPAGPQSIASATLNENGNWFELGEWRRTRVRAVGPIISVYVDYDSNDPALDADADFVPVLHAVDARRAAGRIALNDHYAKSSWDYVRIDGVCGVGDVNCDGYVDFADINPFVLYLSNFAQWEAAFPGCNAEYGDINGDGVYGQASFADINAFVALLTAM